MDEEITVLIVEPNKEPRVGTVDTLESMQKIVGGYLEAVPYEDAILLCAV